MKVTVAGEGQSELISDGVCAEGELITLWLSGGVEIDELEVFEGEFHAVLKDSLSVDDIIIKLGPGSMACSGDGVELVGMADVVEMSDEVFCFAVGNGGVICAVDNEDGWIPCVHKRLSPIHGSPQVDDDSDFRVRTDGSGFLRCGVERGDGAGGTPADPDAHRVNVVGGSVLAKPAYGFGRVLGRCIHRSIEDTEIGGGAGLVGGVIADEPVLDGSTDVAAFGEGLTDIAYGNRALVPSDESTAMNEDHDGSLLGQVCTSGFVNIQVEINGTAGGVTSRTCVILDALGALAPIYLIDKHNAAVSGKGVEE